MPAPTGWPFPCWLSTTSACPPASSVPARCSASSRIALDSGEHPYFESIASLTVSAHFLIERDGSVFQFVSCNDRAWHAGVSLFDGRDNCNDFSIGIELEGTDELPYGDAQYAALAELAGQLLRAYPGITKERIRGHSDIAPGRKTDPGPAFDWPRFLASLDPTKESA